MEGLLYVRAVSPPCKGPWPDQARAEKWQRVAKAPSHRPPHSPANQPRGAQGNASGARSEAP
eukprot:3102643-Alexandrium_andersonii.AAC.1